MWPSRLLRPYRPLHEWAAWRIAEIISPRSFFGRTVTDEPPWDPISDKVPTSAMFEHAQRLAEERGWDKVRP